MPSGILSALVVEFRCPVLRIPREISWFSKVVIIEKLAISSISNENGAALSMIVIDST